MNSSVGFEILTSAITQTKFSPYGSVFREMKKYQKDFSSWCGECLREKKERQRMSIRATKRVMYYIDACTQSLYMGSEGSDLTSQVIVNHTHKHMHRR